MVFHIHKDPYTKDRCSIYTRIIIQQNGVPYKLGSLYKGQEFHINEDPYTKDKCSIYTRILIQKTGVPYTLGFFYNGQVFHIH
jgi:hypothetical protein